MCLIMSGPGESFEDFYRREWAPMVRLARLLVGVASIAEEIAQEAFIAIHKRWGTIESPGGYTHTTVVNLSRSYHRRAKLERERVPRPEIITGEPEVDEMFEKVMQLPENQREALVMRFYLDLTVPQIALAMNIKEGTVKSHIHRGVSALRGELGV